MLYTVDASMTGTTARSSTFVNRDIFLSCSFSMATSDRHNKTSGCSPRERISLTECCVGLVLVSPAVAM